MKKGVRSFLAFALIGAIVFIGFSLANAHERKLVGTESSDPYFRELNQLKEKFGNFERRMGRVESGLKETNAAVTNLAGKIANPRQTVVDKLVFGLTSDAIYVTFESPRSAQISLAVRAAIKKYAGAGYSVREVVLMPSDLRDEGEREILDTDRAQAMRTAFGKVRFPTNWVEQDGLRKDGVVGGLVIVDPPKTKAPASAATP